MAGCSASQPERRTGAAGESPVPPGSRSIGRAWPVPRDTGHHTERDPAPEHLAGAPAGIGVSRDLESQEKKKAGGSMGECLKGPAPAVPGGAGSRQGVQGWKAQPAGDRYQQHRFL